MLKLNKTFRGKEIFNNFSLLKDQNLVERIFFNFLQFLVDIWPLGSGSVDPHIFSDPDKGSQNVTDPDPKYCLFGKDEISKYFHN